MSDEVGGRARVADLINRLRRATLDGDLTAAGDAALAGRTLWRADARAAFSAGNALVRAERLAEAAEAFRIAVALDPDQPSWWRSLIVALGGVEPTREDGDRIDEAAARFPDDAALQVSAARFLAQTGHPDASRVVERALLLAPANRALLRLTEDAARRDGDKGALEAALRVHAGLTDDASVHLRFARALVANGKFEEAADSLAITTTRDSIVGRLLVASLVVQGDVALRLGRQRDAAHVYQRLAVLDPGSIAYHLKAIALVEQTGEREAAEELRTRVIALARETFADGFDAELERSDATDDPAALPPRILDWLWATRPHETIERPDWERKVRVGARRQTVINAVTIAQPDSPDMLIDRTTLAGTAVLDRLRRDGRGVLVVSAHIGPVHAIPSILYHIDPTMRWVASAPAWYRQGFTGAMLSPFAVAPRVVTARVFSALREGRLVMMAPDGGHAATTGVRPFLGSVVPDVRYAATVVALAKAESVFAQARWEGGAIRVLLHDMPSRADFEDEPAFTEAWAEHYYRLVLGQFDEAPENMACRGGLWSTLC